MVTGLCAIGTAVVGVVALAGWVLGIGMLKSGMPGLVAMKPNTAICLALLAGALWAVSSERPRGWRRVLVWTLVAVVLTVGLATLAEFALGVDLGIDQALFHEAPGAVGTFQSGRMALNTSLAFVVIAAAIPLIWAPGRITHWLVAPLALGAGVLALLALFGYMTGVLTLYTVPGYTQMALPTTLGFVLLAVGVIAVRVEQGPMRLIASGGDGGRILRRLLPAAVLIPGVLSVLRLLVQAHGVGAVTADWLFAVLVIALLVPLVWTLAASLEDTDRARQQAYEARLEVQRERIAFDYAPFGSALVSLDGRLTRVNRALCEMLAYPAEELVGMTISSLTHPEDPVIDTVQMGRLVAHGQRTHQLTKRYLRRDGEAVHATVSINALLDHAGRPTQFYGQFKDITERLQAAEDLDHARLETLTRLAAVAEQRDDDTGEHARRVAQLAGAVAERIGMPAERVALIRLAAPLHDIGKIAIPDAVLLKPDRLTPGEFELIKQHTSIGADMLSGSTFPPLAMAEQIALTHHERWDGAGYPQGLSGDHIPLAGRIVAIADVFDALTHARPYKAAWSTRDALAEISRQRQHQFCPMVVDALMAINHEHHGLPPELSAATVG